MTKRPSSDLGKSERHRRRGLGLAIAAALVATAALASAPAATAATIDDSPWRTSFDEVANPSGMLTSTPLAGSYENFSGNNFSQGSLNGLVTAVTSNNEPNSSENADKLRDGNPSTKWFAGASAAWARYELSSSETATRYILATANDAVERNPKNWTLEGSANGSDWTVVDTQTDQLGATDGAPSYFSRHEYTIPTANRGAYKFYRLNITAVNGDVNATQLGDLELIDDARAATHNVGNWNTYVANGPRDSRVAKLGAGFTGTKALEYKGFHTNDDRAKATNVLYQGLDLEIGANSELGYKIFPNLDEFELAYPSTYVSVDLEYTDAGGANPQRLSTTAGLTDQYGYGVSPVDQGRAKTLYGRQWNAVRVNLSDLVGKRITKVLLSYDNPDGSNISEAWGWIDDITLGAATPVDDSDGSLTNFVDTRRGTNSNGDFSRGNNFPATAVPNGFNFYTPFTEGASNRDLYKYQQSNDGQNRPRLQGIGVSHEPSRWISDRNQFQIMPSITEAATPNGDLVARELPFDRSKEVAQPDEYSVEFLNGIKAEIAPADHSAIFRFTFPSSASAGTLFLDKVQTNADFTVSGSTFSGWTDGATAGATRMYVYGTFSAAPTANGTATNRTSAKFVKFATGSPVEVRFATSLISLDQAQHNLALELNGKTFDDIRTSAEQAWDQRLSVIQTTGASEAEKINFYSNLYRLNLYPNAQHENTGTAASPEWKYASPVNATEGSASATQTNAPIKSGKMYVNNGFWDTYRTAWPLYSYLYPDIAAELIDGFVEQYRTGGWIARWSAPGYDNQMTGTSSDASFADAYIQGALSTELAEEVYAAALKNATALPASNVKSDGNYSEERVGRKTFATSPFLGYTPATQDQSVSWGLEGLINDYAIGKMAEKLSTDSAVSPANQARYAQEASYFLTRAEGFVNLFDDRVGDPGDSSTPLGFFTARKADGSWLLEPGAYNLNNRTTVYNPEDWDAGNGTEVNNHTYTETNGWNFAFHAPYDVDGLAALYGGKDGLVAKLDTFFATPEKAETRKIHETYEARDVRMGQWGASNQVSFHIPYIYAAAGHPSGTQKVVREAMQRLFVGSEIGQGYPGDEDNGALGSWYIYSALGFYPLSVGSGQYVLGSPIFDSATITPLGTSNSLTINAANNSTENVYVQSATLDGQALNSATVDQEDLTQGTHTLNLTMGSSASSWGETALAADAPVPAVDAANPQYSSVSAPGATGASRLVDDNSSTVATLGAEQATVTITPVAGSAKVSEYTITNGATGADPTAWTLQGKEANGTWVTIDQRSGQSFAWRSQIRPFVIATPADYTAYRLQITQTSTGQGASIGEIELLVTSASGASGDLTLTGLTGLAGGVGIEFTGTLAGIGGTSDGTGLTATADYGHGPVAAQIVPIPTGGAAVRAAHTFTVAGLHDVQVTVTDGTTTKSVSVQVSATLDNSTAGSVARGADVACFSEVGIAGSCDGQGYAYDKAKVNAAGVQFGVEQSVNLGGSTFYYTLPNVKSGEPDTMTARGQIVTATLNPGATRIAVLGMANEGEQAMRVWLVYSDNTEQEVTVRFGDWVGNATSPIANNTVVFNAPGRLDGTSVEAGAAKNAAVYATNPVNLQIDGFGQVKTLKHIRMETQGSALRDGRTHIVAFASDGSPVPQLVVAQAGSQTIAAKPGVAISPTLATVDGGRGTYTATVNWGDRTGITTEQVAVDGSVSGTHTYAAPGTYTVTITIADGEKSSVVTRTVVVPAPTATTTALTSSAGNVVTGGSVTLTAQVAPATASGSVEFFEGGNSLGSVAVTQGKAAKSVAALATGVYTYTAKYTGDADHLTSTSAPVTVVVAPQTSAKLTVSSPRLTKKSQAYNSVAKLRARAAVVVTGATSGTVTVKSGSKVLGRAKIVKSGKAYTATVVLPAKLAVGTYRNLAATVSANGRTATSARAAGAFKVVKAKTKRVSVKAKAFKRGTKPTVTVSVAKLSNGRWAAGKIQIVVGKKVVRTAKLTAKKKGKLKVTLTKRYTGSIKVRAKFVPASKKTVAAKQSKTVTVKARR